MADSKRSGWRAPLTRTLVAIAMVTAGVGSDRPAAAQTPPPMGEYSSVPIDGSNQAGWWTPIVEHDGVLYFAYNTPGPTPGTHRVAVTRQDLTTGARDTACLAMFSPEGSACFEYPDDVGHHQPSIAVDRDGYIHVFTAMHSSAWSGHYFRSRDPGRSDLMIEQGADLPDPTWTHTYPIPATAPDGSLWLAVRSRSSATARGVGGRLYHYDPATQTWERAATFAYTPGLWVYPDDVQVDADGRVHIAFEWVKKHTNAFPHIGAYTVYDPATGTFANAAGDDLGSAPVTVDSPVVYQPWSPLYDPDARYNGLGVQTAKLALEPESGRPHIAYRYTPRYGDHLAVMQAWWDGTAWQRETVYAGRYDTFPTVDITVDDTNRSFRIYYAKQNLGGRLGTAFVAWRVRPGLYDERTLVSAHPFIQRLSAITLDDGTDILYLSAPLDRAPDRGQLYLGRLTRPDR